MGPAAVAKPEMASAKLERRVSENVTRPRATKPRQKHRIDPMILVNRFLRLDDRRIRRRRRGVITAGHVDVDVGKTFFRELCFEGSERALRGLVRHKAQIKF